MKKFLIIILILAILLVVGILYWSSLEKFFFRTISNSGTEGVKKEEVKESDIEVVAEGLEVPWEIAFLPSGEMLVTERPGRLLKISSTREIIPIEGVYSAGEAGLLGLAIHPDFDENNLIYLYSTTESGGKVENRVELYTLLGNTLAQRKVVLSGIPGSAYHDGGRIAFGPDGDLYITTGDAGKEQSAQDKTSLAGKILRVTDEGGIPADNPFGNVVYSYGHRNPQGLAWDSSGQLWASEHGRSGVRSGYDEVNRIQKGGNYGWPVIEGDKTQQGMISPVAHSGAADTWAPAGIAYHQNNFFFAGLRGSALYQFDRETPSNLKTHFKEEYGRLRVVTIGPDGFLYVSTSNRDGRGTIQAGDDKILKINPEIFR